MCTEAERHYLLLTLAVPYFIHGDGSWNALNDKFDTTPNLSSCISGFSKRKGIASRTSFKRWLHVKAVGLTSCAFAPPDHDVIAALRGKEQKLGKVRLTQLYSCFFYEPSLA